MLSRIRAKVTVHRAERSGGSERVELGAVKSGGDDPEDNAFATATPYLKLEMTIDNPDAQGYFQPGRRYYLDVTPAD